MEFKLITDLTQLPQTVEFNVEELKNELTEKLAYYENLVVTEDAVRDAKSDKAKLNKLRTAIDTKRKEVKKACLAPYEEFERQCRDILDMIDRPINSIDQQIKVFEQKELDAKYAELEKHFQSCMVGIDVPVELDKILNPKWQNKTMKLDALKREISDCIEQICDDVKSIRYAYGDTPHLTAVLKCYYEGYDAGAAHVYANALINEQHRQEALAKSAQDAAHAPSTSNPEITAPTPQSVTQEPSEPAESIQTDGKQYTCTFRATGTREQLRTARDHMLSIGLKIESV